MDSKPWEIVWDEEPVVAPTEEEDAELMANFAKWQSAPNQKVRVESWRKVDHFMRMVNDDQEAELEKDHLKEDEGVKLSTDREHVVYRLGKEELLTAGRGHQLDTPEEIANWKEGDIVSQAQVDKWFEEDFREVKEEVDEYFEGYNVPQAAKNIAINLRFNMSPSSFHGFTGFKEAVIAGDYKRAAEELRWTDPDNKAEGETDYYGQVQRRAPKMMKRLNKLAKEYPPSTN